MHIVFHKVVCKQFVISGVIIEAIECKQGICKMDGSSAKEKRNVTKISSDTSKKLKAGEVVKQRKLNQDMIDQMSSSGAKSRRSKTNLPIHD